MNYEDCLAYHTIRSGGEAELHKVIEHGYLTPPKARVARKAVEEELRIFLLTRRGLDPKIKKAIERLAKKEIDQLPVDGQERVGLSLANILMGDLDETFFTPRLWYPADDVAPAIGFVFRCHHLIALGACYRPFDLGAFLDDEVLSRWEEEGKTFRSIDQAEEALSNEIALIRRRYTFCDETAIEALYHPEEEVYDEAELVINNPVPIDVAVEIWAGERQIK